MGLACCARPPAHSTQRDLTWETNLFHVPGLAPQPADRMTFQQKIMEGKARKVSSMGPNHMLLKKKPKRHQNTEQTLNREWSFGCAPKSIGSSSPAGLGGHLRSCSDHNKLNVVAALSRFYADQEESDEACVACEKNIASLADAARRLVLWTHALSGVSWTPPSNAAVRSSRRRFWTSQRQTPRRTSP